MAYEPQTIINTMCLPKIACQMNASTQAYTLPRTAFISYNLYNDLSHVHFLRGKYWWIANVLIRF